MWVRTRLFALFVMASTTASHAAPTTHHCTADALQQAEKLLKFHNNNDDRAEVSKDSSKFIGSVPALVGKGHFDVLEVWGSVYKGEYRMHFLYAQLPDDCALMGEEILEHSDPY